MLRRSKFSFWVRKANPRKVVIYLQGGGALLLGEDVRARQRPLQDQRPLRRRTDRAGGHVWLYLWRNVANELAQRLTVYVCDLLGYGNSEKREGQDVSIGARTRMLVELLELWGLGSRASPVTTSAGANTLRVMLLDGRPRQAAA
jgi:pimeloyl-ACP methyl ester carboxylesterase